MSLTASRIPTDLQAVFLASNSGEEVHKPPTSKSAFRVFKSVIPKGIKKKLLARQNRKALRSSSIGSASSFSGTVPSEFDSFHESKQHGVISPQAWLEHTLRERGYNVNRTCTTSTAYMSQPTALQLASFEAKTMALASSRRLDQAGPLRDILSCGISLNACNVHGETLMHKACRLGYHHILAVFIELGAELQVCDAQGRTLLHEACWGDRPSFQTFTMLMHHAPELLFMADSRGACPLDYVKQSHYVFWLDFLGDNQDIFWPIATPADSAFVLSERAAAKPNSIPIPDPANAVSCQLALMVASGKMKPKDLVLFLASEGESTSHDDSWSSISSSNDEDDDGLSIASWCDEEENMIEELASFLDSLKSDRTTEPLP